MSILSRLTDKLKEIANDQPEETEYWQPSEIQKLCKEAAETIEELSKKLHASQMERSIQYYNGGWIPCEERMPEEHDSSHVLLYGTSWWRPYFWLTESNVVLVTAEVGPTFHEMFLASTHDGKWTVDDNYLSSAQPVAWMPLPEIYDPKRKMKQESIKWREKQKKKKE